MPDHRIIWAGTLPQFPTGFPAGHFDLSFASPPYANQRKYGKLDFKLKGDAWVDWAFEKFEEQLHATRGAVAWVVNGTTSKFRYDLIPEKLLVRLDAAGYSCRKSPIYHRHGISGSGGPDYFRDDYEVVIFAQRNQGKLPWSDNTACGHPCKYPPGGKMSHRTASDKRVGDPVYVREHHKRGTNKKEVQGYRPPALANPGNVQKVVVGGGHMGSPLAHANEAPFSEAIADRYIRSFCPPGGVVLDAFNGSGTTMAAAHKAGRSSVGMDVRLSQCWLAQVRMYELTGEIVLIDSGIGGIGDPELFHEEIAKLTAKRGYELPEIFRDRSMPFFASVDPGFRYPEISVAA